MLEHLKLNSKVKIRISSVPSSRYMSNALDHQDQLRVTVSKINSTSKVILWSDHFRSTTLNLSILKTLSNLLVTHPISLLEQARIASLIFQLTCVGKSKQIGQATQCGRINHVVRGKEIQRSAAGDPCSHAANLLLDSMDLQGATLVLDKEDLREGCVPPPIIVRYFKMTQRCNAVKVQHRLESMATKA